MGILRVDSEGIPTLIQSMTVQYDYSVLVTLMNGVYCKVEADMVPSYGKFDEAYYSDLESKLLNESPWKELLMKYYKKKVKRGS